MESLTSETVVILGASDNPERYSHKAMLMLQKYGHKPVLVSPRYECINGLTVHKTLNEISEADTLTMYVNPKISSPLVDVILALRPKRVIFNPGTENPELSDILIKNGIEVEDACTLVLLSTGQF